jgi:hypothetical protein
MTGIEVNTGANPSQHKDEVLERRCPRCGWYLWELRAISGTVKSEHIFEISAKCGNRKCKRRDKYKILTEGVAK